MRASSARRWRLAGALLLLAAPTRAAADVTPGTSIREELVQVHGGAWMTGSKEQQGAPLMGHLAERGWVSVALNYRLSPRSTWPDQIVDV